MIAELHGADGDSILTVRVEDADRQDVQNRPFKPVNLFIGFTLAEQETCKRRFIAINL